MGFGESAEHKSARLERKANRPVDALVRKIKGLALTDTEIRYQGEGGPLAGVRATVESEGDIDRRITATRLLLTGPFALGLRKKKDHRQLYLTVEGPEFGFVIEVDPDDALVARQLAAKLSAKGRSQSDA